MKGFAKITVFTIFARLKKKHVKRILYFFTLLSICLGNSAKAKVHDGNPKMHLLEIDSVKNEAVIQFEQYVESLYADLGDTTLNANLLKEGVTGYLNMLRLNQLQRKDTLTLIDFSKPSNQERFYIIDLANREILHKTIVAHGVNSGKLYAKYFSNASNSRKSSLGFYSTTTTYSGKYDLALRINGLESTNSHASSRGVVIHAAKYATYEFLERNGGMLGRSYGCPALPYTNFHKIVEWIKGGSCLYIYHPKNPNRLKSKYLNEVDYLVDFI